MSRTAGPENKVSQRTSFRIQSSKVGRPSIRRCTKQGALADMNPHPEGAKDGKVKQGQTLSSAAIIGTTHIGRESKRIQSSDCQNEPTRLRPRSRDVKTYVLDEESVSPKEAATIAYSCDNEVENTPESSVQMATGWSSLYRRAARTEERVILITNI
jgi:hypothetical protein